MDNQFEKVFIFIYHDYGVAGKKVVTKGTHLAATVQPKGKLMKTIHRRATSTRGSPINKLMDRNAANKSRSGR